MNDADRQDVIFDGSALSLDAVEFYRFEDRAAPGPWARADDDDRFQPYAPIWIGVHHFTYCGLSAPLRGVRFDAAAYRGDCDDCTPWRVYLDWHHARAAWTDGGDCAVAVVVAPSRPIRLIEGEIDTLSIRACERVNYGVEDCETFLIENPSIEVNN